MNTTSYALLWTPLVAGWWCLGGYTRFAAAKRPRWLTRVLMQWLLEITWEEKTDAERLSAFD